MVKAEAKKRTRSAPGARSPARAGATPVGLAESPRPVAEVWERYRSAPTVELRNELIERYLPLVRYHAERLHTRLPRHVSVDDLVSHGLMGLIDAIADFDPGRNIKFETFSALRISGAILDELRAIDWVPRAPRARAAKVESVRARLQMETGSRPTPDEVFQRLREREPRADLIIKDATVTSMRPLAHARRRTDDDREFREIDTVRDSRQSDPARSAQARDLRDSFIRALSRAERLIVILYYQEEMTMKEIGATLCLSESRVSQLHASIMTRLRDLGMRRAEDARG